jgi:hypothetical protein
VDEEEQPLKERVNLVKVCLDRLLLPLKLRFWAYRKYLIPQPLVLKNPIKQLSVAALLKLLRVALVLKEVPVLLLIAVVILKAVEEDLRHDIVASFFRIQEKQPFQLFLGLSNLDSYEFT